MKHKISLASGTLDLCVERADLPLETLCAFADRQNTRRGFLFVSKVLGKHYPVTPAMMTKVHQLLAGKLDGSVEGPIVFVALAETAIGLGQSVYEHFRLRTGREDTLFVHTTRYAVGNGPRISFSEKHSHAPSHLLHHPSSPDDLEMFRTARSIVIIDDEITTGNTLLNVLQAYSAINPHLRNVTLTCITDWLGSAGHDTLSSRMSLRPRYVNVLEGTASFLPSGIADTPAPRLETVLESKDEVLRSNFGRLGLRDLPPLAPELVSQASRLLAARSKILVLGTGEFLYLPFKLATRLEALGHHVVFQSTTRSPIHVGADIETKLELIDNYFDHLPNYLYNVPRGAHDVVIACYETARLPADHKLPQMLGAMPVMFT